MALPRSPRQRILATPRREYLPAPGPQLFLLSVSTATTAELVTAAAAAVGLTTAAEAAVGLAAVAVEDVGAGAADGA